MVGHLGSSASVEMALVIEEISRHDEEKRETDFTFHHLPEVCKASFTIVVIILAFLLRSR